MNELVWRLMSLAETQRKLADDTADKNERQRLLKEADWHTQWAKRQITEIDNGHA